MKTAIECLEQHWKKFQKERAEISWDQIIEITEEEWRKDNGQYAPNVV